MQTKYGELPNELVTKNESNLIDQIFRLLPYKEYHIEGIDLDYCFETLQFRITGMARIFPQYPEWLTIMCLLEAAKTESNFRLYRKAILDCCSMVKEIQDSHAGSV